MNKLIVIFNEYNFRDNWDVVWFSEFINELYNNFDLIYINPNEYCDETFIKKYGKIPDFIIGYEIFVYPENNSKKILITEDLHHRSLEVYDNLFNKIDIILPRFNIIKTLFNNKFEKKIIDFPLYCSNKFLVDNINLNSINKIILYGNINNNLYKLRYKWHNFMIDNYNDKIIYIKKNSDETAKTIRNYTFGLVSGYIPEYFEKFNDNNCYIVAKFFEVTGSGLLLLADSTGLNNELKKYGFIDNVNYIDINFNNIHDKIKFIFDEKNSSKINLIRNNGLKLIKDNHLIDNRINTIKNIFNK